jgi:hypothetical protein
LTLRAMQVLVVSIENCFRHNQVALLYQVRHLKSASQRPYYDIYFDKERLLISDKGCWRLSLYSGT